MLVLSLPFVVRYSTVKQFFQSCKYYACVLLLLKKQKPLKGLAKVLRVFKIIEGQCALNKLTSVRYLYFCTCTTESVQYWGRIIVALSSFHTYTHGALLTDDVARGLPVPMMIDGDGESKVCLAVLYWSPLIKTKSAIHGVSDRVLLSVIGFSVYTYSTTQY